MLELKAQGVTSIIISHKLNEVRYVADSVTVIRDGMTVSTLDAKAGHERGRDRARHGRPRHDAPVPERSQRTPAGELLMEVDNWTVWHPEHTERKVIKKRLVQRDRAPARWSASPA